MDVGLQAAQGAHLAADRGTLESKVEGLTVELAEARKTAANLRDTIRIKTKVAEVGVCPLHVPVTLPTMLLLYYVHLDSAIHTRALTRAHVCNQ